MPTDTTNTQETVLNIRGLRVDYPIRGRRSRREATHVRAVAGVDLDIRKGETLGLVGESGCGKTTLGSSVMRVRPEATGTIRYRDGEGRLLNALELSREDEATYRREVRMVFQDPHSSLNPRMTLRDIIGEPLRMLTDLRSKELDDRVHNIMERVGLHPEHLTRYPHAFSGGQRQRVSIARALVPGPRLVVADEAVSALDTSIRSQILNLLQDLQDEMGLTYLFISHDLSVVEHVCDRVAVMYLGRIVEVSPTEELFRAPLHPYTEALISAVPALENASAWPVRCPTRPNHRPVARSIPGAATRPNCASPKTPSRDLSARDAWSLAITPTTSTWPGSPAPAIPRPAPAGHPPHRGRSRQ